MINEYGPHAKPILVARMIHHHLDRHNNRLQHVQAHADFKELIDRSFQQRVKKNPKKELQERVRLKTIQKDNDHLFKRLAEIYKGKYKESNIISPRRHSPDSSESLLGKKVYLPQIETRAYSKPRDTNNILDDLYLPTGPTPKTELYGEDKQLFKQEKLRKYPTPKKREATLHDISVRSPNDSIIHVTKPAKQNTIGYMLDTEDEDLIPPVNRTKNVTIALPIIFQRKVKFKNSVFVFKVQDYEEILVLSMRDSDYGKEYQLTLTPHETFKIKAKYGTEYEKLIKHLRIEREKLILNDHYSLSIRNSANLAELKEKANNKSLMTNNTADGLISPIRENLPVESHDVPGYTYEKEKPRNRHNKF